MAADIAVGILLAIPSVLAGDFHDLDVIHVYVLAAGGGAAATAAEVDVGVGADGSKLKGVGSPLAVILEVKPLAGQIGVVSHVAHLHVGAVVVHLQIQSQDILQTLSGLKGLVQHTAPAAVTLQVNTIGAAVGSGVGDDGVLVGGPADGGTNLKITIEDEAIVGGTLNLHDGDGVQIEIGNRIAIQTGELKFHRSIVGDELQLNLLPSAQIGVLPIATILSFGGYAQNGPVEAGYVDLVPEGQTVALAHLGGNVGVGDAAPIITLTVQTVAALVGSGGGGGGTVVHIPAGLGVVLKGTFLNQVAGHRILGAAGGSLRLLGLGGAVGHQHEIVEVIGAGAVGGTILSIYGHGGIGTGVELASDLRPSVGGHVFDVLAYDGGSAGVVGHRIERGRRVVAIIVVPVGQGVIGVGFNGHSLLGHGTPLRGGVHRLDSIATAMHDVLSDFSAAIAGPAAGAAGLKAGVLQQVALYGDVGVLGLYGSFRLGTATGFDDLHVLNPSIPSGAVTGLNQEYKAGSGAGIEGERTGDPIRTHQIRRSPIRFVDGGGPAGVFNGHTGLAAGLAALHLERHVVVGVGL